MAYAEDEESSTLTWLVFLLIACISVYAGCYFASLGSGGNFVKIYVYCVPVVFLIAGVFHFLVGRRVGIGKAIVSFAVLLLLMNVAAGMIYFTQQREQHKMGQSLQKDLASMRDFVNEGKPIDAPIDPTPSASGEAGEVERFMKAYFNRVAAQRNEYLAAVEATGWNGILDPTRLKRDVDMSDSRRIMQAVKEIVQNYKLRTHELLAAVLKDVDHMALSDAGKAQFRAGFEQGLQRGGIRADAVWDLEMRIVSQIETAVEYLFARNHAWSVENGQFLFQQQSDLDEFNGQMAKVDGLVAQQEALQKEGFDKAEQGLQRLGM
ncbi:MAG TPA: hypothetical protein VJU83_08350 [Burkholderiales bacterium]|nr:hypothetical protein [Burkholderiales bacterium]